MRLTGATFERPPRLLDEAGWEISGDDGMRIKDGKPLSANILSGLSPAFDRIINPYVENLKRPWRGCAKLDRVDRWLNTLSGSRQRRF